MVYSFNVALNRRETKQFRQLCMGVEFFAFNANMGNAHGAAMARLLRLQFHQEDRADRTLEDVSSDVPEWKDEELKKAFQYEFRVIQFLKMFTGTNITIKN